MYDGLHRIGADLWTKKAGELSFLVGGSGVLRM